MQIIADRTIGKAWLNYMKHILSNGKLEPDDRENIFEVGPLYIEITNPSKQDEIVERFGDQHVIETYVKKMFSKEIIPELNSTYGDRLFDNSGVDQIEWVSDRLQRKWWTKGACISLLKPNDPGPRIPCLTQLQFVIRSGQVNLEAVFRSQNAYRAYGNFYGLLEVQGLIATKIRKRSGKLGVFITCPHIYGSDLPKARAIVHAASFPNQVEELGASLVPETSGA
jgi:thymidylate synthase